MAEPTKANSDIEAAPDEFHAALERARQAFARIDGVISVGFGRKRVGDELTDRIAIMVFVREKKPESALAPADRIPKSFEGYATDVRVVGRGHAEGCDNETAYSSIQGGIQIEIDQGESTTGQGTLGCIVRKRASSARENVYLLTNKHVLFSEHKGVGNTVYHPKKSDTALGPVQWGFYENALYPQEGNNQRPFFIDAAIARINLDTECCCCTCTKDSTTVAEAQVVDLDIGGDNTLRDVRSVIDDVNILNERVFKVGRTTSKTKGIVTAVGAPLVADPPPDTPHGANVNATNLIEIRFDTTSTPNGQNCEGNPNFTEQGDSGSLIVDEQQRAIGLHTHGHVNPQDHIKYSYACHILPVLDYLQICIPCVVVPTLIPSHGNSLATDGSGVALRALPAAERTLAPQISFTRASVPATPHAPPFTPLAVTDEQVQHMRALLARFRETPLGPELHEVFGHVRGEIGYLVRNVRPVKVVWARNEGPAFLALVLKHVMGQTRSLPHAVKGVTRRQFLVRMRAALNAHGSILVRESLARYGDGIIEALAHEDCNSIEDCIESLQEKEPA
jgi:hypothetical protein